MPRNGTGGYSLPNNSWNPAVNGAAATAADWQALINDVATAIQNSVSSDGQTTMTGSLNMGGFVVAGLGAPSGTGQSLRWEQLIKGADIPSAAALPVPVEGSVFAVTGSTSITSLTDVYPGRIVYLIFPAGITIVNAGFLQLPGGANIVTKANDVIAFMNESPGIWRAIAYPARLDTATGVIPSGGFKNLLINGNFNVNQRGVGGTVVLAAGAYGHDRWKAGSGGCTYTYTTSNGITTINISSGTLSQVVEGNNVKSGVYTLSWSGTALGKFGGGVFSPSGVSAAVTGGIDSGIEFSTGTVSLAQLEFGSNATLFEFRPIGVESQLCLRYAFVLNNAGSTPPICPVSFIAFNNYGQGILNYPAEMRAPPTFSFLNGSAASLGVQGTGGGNIACTTFSVDWIGLRGCRVSVDIASPLTQGWTSLLHIVTAPLLLWSAEL
ncbi:hypothetical protein [Achromobacter xylosoxidans]|uniref:Uncharacterized protein n=1 Tax=Alcaligenes xylosoxydans xylosoxydans TaxID=85698 RepID=A0A424W3H0_ALCXX|nr:hypothetical protein [Achromobacter xylosoxidans]MBC9904757.1 hypothetical protein [Achromobacter xylosoxidans]MBD0868674.1 hypothetical protein [Achromobacter xylosoxidans]QNP87823.1 hypothetical protein IAG39_10055 [Achromobacter xylosoxidans]RPJ87777.1 hypothetical protein DY367_31210 [Achromobacter xylosoxidans]